jgi:general stress protein 26
MTTHVEHEENVRKLRELIKGIEVAMLTTIEDDGSLRSRPMATQKIEFAGDLYFFTKVSMPKVEEVERDRHLCVSFAAPEKQCYVSMSGRARLLRDRAKMEELWFPELKVWLPDGLEDPELVLLWITVTQAQYWEGPSATLMYMLGLKTMAAGAAFDDRNNQKLNLKGAE